MRLSIPLTTPWIIDRYVEWFSGSSAVAGAAWPTANMCYYYPFVLPTDGLCNGVSVVCTSGNSAGRNWDVGFYDTSVANVPTNKLSSQGATLVAAGLNTWVASQQLTGGVPYWVGFSANNTSLNFVRRSAGSVGRITGFAQEASAHPLPTTPTPAQIVTANIYIVALSFANL